MHDRAVDHGAAVKTQGCLYKLGIRKVGLLFTMQNRNSLGQTFSEAINDADAWRRQADQLLTTAIYLSTKAVVPETRSNHSITLAVGSLKATLLLLALAVENSLKAVAAERGEIKIESGKVNRKSLGGGKSGHSLLDLAKRVGIRLSMDEEVLLGKLSTAALWSGKYQQPLDESAFYRCVLSEPRSLRIPEDLNLTKALIDRVRTLQALSADA